jgi:hypothetical protein
LNCPFPERLPFTLQPRTPKAFGVDFFKRICPEKNREIFRILQSHNMLSTRYLQKNAETSIYKNTEIGKAEMSLKNLTADALTDHGKPG